jgi:hypothetical protein
LQIWSRTAKPLPDQETGRGRQAQPNRTVPDPHRCTVLETTKPWTRLLRGQRHIGDFTCWKDHDAYQKVLERLLRDLKVTQAAP